VHGATCLENHPELVRAFRNYEVIIAVERIALDVSTLLPAFKHFLRLRIITYNCAAAAAASARICFERDENKNQIEIIPIKVFSFGSEHVAAAGVHVMGRNKFTNKNRHKQFFFISDLNN
jgi:hypothetical protein